VALDQDIVVGTIALKDIGNRQIALRKMFVHKDYRGKEKAIAFRLLQQAFAWAKDKGRPDIFLGTTSKFFAAHRFYEKNGFNEIRKSQLPPNFPIMAVDSKFYHYKNI
jgi:N-acetylglutamate synthase-like GNAT family acetyltransferase